jgi:glucose-1-phosphate thymidylyltransferase
MYWTESVALFFARKASGLRVGASIRMKALILSGGKGTRLQPLTYTHAKQLVPVANKPVLFYALEAIVSAGISDIGIVVGDTYAEIEAAVRDGREFGAEVSVTYIRQEQPLGLAHAVKIAQPFLQDDRFLMFLGDNFIGESLETAVQQFSEPTCSSQAQIFLKSVPNPQQFGVALLTNTAGVPVADPNGLDDRELRVSHLVEKPREPISKFALVGIYLFDHHIFEAVNAICPSQRGELEITDALQYLIEQGYNVQPHIVNGYWIDTGQMRDMLEANRTVLSSIKREIAESVNIDQASRIEGEVILEESVHLINSVVRGPSIIGNNVTLTNAYIGPFTAIAHDSVVINSEIEHSIVLEGCRIYDINRRIEDSLIGCHTEIFPSSAKPRAYKLLLGDNSRIGIL